MAVRCVDGYDGVDVIDNGDDGDDVEGCSCGDGDEWSEVGGL